MLQDERASEDLVKQNVLDNQQEIKIGNEPIEKVNSFLYLGRWMTVNDSDEMAAINKMYAKHKPNGKEFFQSK